METMCKREPRPHDINNSQNNYLYAYTSELDGGPLKIAVDSIGAILIFGMIGIQAYILW